MTTEWLKYAYGKNDLSSEDDLKNQYKNMLDCDITCYKNADDLITECVLKLTDNNVEIIEIDNSNMKAISLTYLVPISESENKSITDIILPSSIKNYTITKNDEGCHLWLGFYYKPTLSIKIGKEKLHELIEILID